MFNPFKKKTGGEKVIFEIQGMHCASCGMNIDGELEDTQGVISASTSYAKARSVVEYDPGKVSKDRLKRVIEGLDYRAEEIKP